MPTRGPASLPSPLARYSSLASTAIHEAGHVTLAFQLGRGIHSVTVVADDHRENLGSLRCTSIGPWFRPHVQVTRRVRHLVETQVMITLVGLQTETTWCPWLRDAPVG